MDEYATRLMNEAININYIDETEYPRVAVMCQKCINIMANLWNTPETNKWKAGALAIGNSTTLELQLLEMVIAVFLRMCMIHKVMY